MPRRDWRVRVADMLDAAETAISLTAGLSRAGFLDDRVLVDAAPVLRRMLEAGQPPAG